MQQNILLDEAAITYLSTLSDEDKRESDLELNRFSWWFGKDKLVSELKPINIEEYTNWVSTLTKDPAKKLEPVRSFLIYLKKQGLVNTNLAIHLRVKKTVTKVSKSKKQSRNVHVITSQGREKLESELNELRKERPKTIEEITRAAADKDFRENAPLEAAREYHGRIETRIREIETTLKSAEIAEVKVEEKDKIYIGCKVTIVEKSKERKFTYSLVSPSEVDVSKGKISVLSPIGKSLLEHCEGDEIEVVAPLGRLIYIIEKVEI